MIRHQRTIAVTGATSGLGLHVALKLAGPGTHLLLHGRDAVRGAEAVRAVERAGATARFYRSDFTSLQGVHALADAVRRDHEQLDVLVNNAGIAILGRDRRVSRDGIELHFAVNHLAPLRLTEMLLPILGRTAPSKVVTVSSSAQAPIDFNNVMLERDYDGFRAYSQSKLAQVMATIDFAESVSPDKVQFNALHPASNMDTPLVRSAGIVPTARVDEGVAAVLSLVDADHGDSGYYYDGLERASPNSQALDGHARHQLRALNYSLL